MHGQTADVILRTQRINLCAAHRDRTRPDEDLVQRSVREIGERSVKVHGRAVGARERTDRVKRGFFVRRLHAKIDVTKRANVGLGIETGRSPPLEQERPHASGSQGVCECCELA